MELSIVYISFQQPLFVFDVRKSSYLENSAAIKKAYAPQLKEKDLFCINYIFSFETFFLQGRGGGGLFKLSYNKYVQNVLLDLV